MFSPPAKPDAIILLPGTGRIWDQPSDPVKGLGERLIFGLERNLPSRLRFQSESGIENLKEPFGKTSLERVSVSIGPNDPAVPLFDLYALELSNEILRRYTENQASRRD